MRKRDIVILTSAFLSFILSVYLWFSGDKEMGQYVSIWVPTIIIYGIFLNTLPKKWMTFSYLSLDAFYLLLFY